MKITRIAFVVAIAFNLASAVYFVRLNGLSVLKDRFSGPNALWRDYRQSPYQQGRASVHSALSDLNNAPKIVFIGDSIIEHCNWSELLGCDAINRGVAGDEVAGVLARIGPILETKPRRIFLMIGINNLLRGDSTDSVVDAYKALVSKIHESKTPLVIASILPVLRTSSQSSEVAARVQEVNKALAQLADGQTIHFLDLHSHFSDSSGFLLSDFTFDGLHLSGAGYLKWRDCLQSEFR